MRRLRGRFTYANVIATVALFCALGGGAYAAMRLPANSVGKRQLKKNAVTSAKVRNHSLRVVDFKPGQLPAGADGQRGLEGPPGPKGAPGAAKTLTRYGPDIELGTSAGTQSYASCEPGEAVAGGGYDFAGSGRPNNESYFIDANRPSIEEESLLGEPPAYPAPADGSAPSGWMVYMENDTGFSFHFRAYVVCASP
jgi:hypothetical protein